MKLNENQPLNDFAQCLSLNLTQNKEPKWIGLCTKIK